MAKIKFKPELPLISGVGVAPATITLDGKRMDLLVTKLNREFHDGYERVTIEAVVKGRIALRPPSAPLHDAARDGVDFVEVMNERGEAVGRAYYNA